MRDVLPPFADRQSAVGREVMRAFALAGYQRVWLPTFEYAGVLERSRDAPGQSLRFIEPETGEVVALRADMTPQIARVVSTRCGEQQGPIRLAYQGSVLRRRAERARLESQTVQAGAELVGQPGPEGDREVVALMCDAVRAARLESFVLDLGHAGLVGALLRDVPPPLRAPVTVALEAKDKTQLETLLKAAPLQPAERRALVALVDLHGDTEVLMDAERALQATAAVPYLRELRDLAESLSELAPEVVIDLGETRDLDYYTGVVFQLLALGPGEPVASGGRYDGLHERFGSSRAAAGFAIDINHLLWALSDAQRSFEPPPRVVLEEGISRGVIAALRGADVACCTAPSPRAYAQYWEGAAVLRSTEAGWVLVRGDETLGAGLIPSGSEPETLARIVRERLRS